MNNSLLGIIIGCGIILLGAVISYFLSKRRNYHTSKPDFLEDKVEKSDAINHYEKTRDKIVKKSYKRKEDDDEGFVLPPNLLSRTIGAIVFIVLFINVILPMLTTVCTTIIAMNDSSMPGVDMLCSSDGKPGLFLWMPIVIGFIVSVINIISGFRSSDGD